MNPILDRIQKLLALAVGNDEEARSAAHLAVKLIRVHQVELFLAPVLSTSKKPTTEPVPDGDEDLANIYDALGIVPPWVRYPERYVSNTPRPNPPRPTPPRESAPISPDDPFDFEAAVNAKKSR